MGDNETEERNVKDFMEKMTPYLVPSLSLLSFHLYHHPSLLSSPLHLIAFQVI